VATIAGYNGKVVFGAAGSIISDANHNVTSWKLDYTADTVDNTDFTTTGWKTFLATLKTWGGSLEMFVDSGNPLEIADVGTSGAIQLYLSDALYYGGTAICTGIHPSVGVEGIETQTVDFQGSGALTLT